MTNQIDEDAQWAEEQSYPEPSTALDHIYSSDSIKDEADCHVLSHPAILVVSARQGVADNHCDRNRQLYLKK